MFELTGKQQRDFLKFREDHNCTLEKDEFGKPKVGAIGGRFTFSFTPTGLGVCTVVKCACGAILDLTDVDSW